MKPPLFCCDDLRRDAIRDLVGINGLDYLEVVDHDEPDLTKRQRFLKVHFVNPPVWALDARNVEVEGGERIRKIEVVNAQLVGDVLEVEVDPRGDFSPYVLRLVPSDDEALTGLDPALSEIAFSFKVECATEFDCRTDESCPPEESEPPRIDYLAKDYASFRRLMLDRMALLAPTWTERNPADLGIALVEMLAYVADHLSYTQDAVATEAYLRTARLRTSVRRHARLVDYRMHDGCNARVFIRFEAGAELTLPTGTVLLTRMDDHGTRIDPADLPRVLVQEPEVFETMHALDLHVAHNELPLHAWSSRNCCLPRGATSATLRGHFPELQAGDLLLFEEVLGPRTGEAADADPAHRHVVRLVDAQLTEDPAPDENGDPVPITEIRWADDDALPFPLCVSSTTDEAHGNRFIEDVSVARGNIAIADHGRTIAGEALGTVPEPSLFRPAPEGTACDFSEAVAIPPRFRPRLQHGPLTQQARAFDAGAPAAHAMQWAMDEVLPAVALTTMEDGVPLPWDALADLFESDDSTRGFVAEVEEDGLASIRFGDDDYGRRPLPGLAFAATYRAGNGTAGNVGADSIAHIVTTDTGIDSVTNPLPARGGVDPETLEHVRQSAPAAFRVQERAVTEDDYAMVTMRRPGIDRAAATFRWTGSWHTLFDSVDRIGGREVDDPFRRDLRAYLERYRVVGHDVAVDAPRFVALDVILGVCVKPEYFRADVKRELLDVFRRFFHPDNFTFGQSVYLSRIIAAAQSVEGVDSITVERFRRRGVKSSEAKHTGELPMGRLEVARLDGNPDFPERGRLTLEMRGGR